MAERGNFNIQIGATDNATKVLKQLNRQLEHLRAPMVALHKQAAKFAELSGLRQLAEHAKSFAEQARNVALHVGAIAAPLAAITGAASIGGMIELVRTWAEFGEKLGFSAQRIGIAAPLLKQLENTAYLAGAATGSMTDAMKKLGDVTHAAAFGGNAEVQAITQGWGIALRDANGHVRNANSLLPELMKHLRAIRDPNTQARTAAAFGFGEDLLPMLRMSADEFEKLQIEARKLAPYTEEQQKLADRLAEAWHRVNLAGENLKNQIVIGLAPAMQRFLEGLTQWLSAHPDVGGKIAAGILVFVAKLQAAWPRIETFFVGFGAGVQKVVDFLGGWERATYVVLGVWTLTKFAPLFIVLERIAALAIAATASLVGLGVASRAAAAAALPAAAAGAGGVGSRLAGAGGALLGGLMSPFGLALSGVGLWAWLTSMLRPGGVKPISPGQSEMPGSSQAPFPYPRTPLQQQGGLMPHPDLTKISSPAGVNFTVAKSAADAFRGFLADIEKAGYSLDQSQSGGYNPRKIAGTNTWSQHAFGTAIDINWQRNARGANTPSDIPPELAHQLANKWGLTWGGDWRGGSRDPMHFEIARQAALANALPPWIDQQVRKQADAYGLNKAWMAALAFQESGTKGMGARSPAGAIGTMQLMPGTVPGFNALDPTENVRGGMARFEGLLRQYHEDYRLATAAYNLGPNDPRMQQFAKTGDPSGLPETTRGYLERITQAAGGTPGEQTATKDGKVEVHVNFENTPPGTKTKAYASGGAVRGAPKVSHAMDFYGA